MVSYIVSVFFFIFLMIMSWIHTHTSFSPVSFICQPQAASQLIMIHGIGDILYIAHYIWDKFKSKERNWSTEAFHHLLQAICWKHCIAYLQNSNHVLHHCLLVENIWAEMCVTRKMNLNDLYFYCWSWIIPLKTESE